MDDDGCGLFRDDGGCGLAVGLFSIGTVITRIFVIFNFRNIFLLHFDGCLLLGVLN